nr:hypothetical protein B0A51_13732 [Rachicladosporium sp. CCFEE 5018]OQO18507.1 hypothetical protein B0A51_14250 [Rachicladosporium sp. CCFEE 5018]
MNPADLAINTSPTLANKTPTSALPSALKNGKVPVPRIDLEPLYTNLKVALGEQWTDYKAAVNAFVLGNLSQPELTYVLAPLLSPIPSVIPASNFAAPPVSLLSLHNTLITCLYANVQRDAPPTEVAPWVVATDKPAAGTKTAGATGTNDATEERLKREVMSLHARDRRRVKALKGEGKVGQDAALKEVLEYRRELEVAQPEIAPPTGGGLAKTNWDLEIRRKYALPFAAETLEFPSMENVLNRVEPICYEEGLSGGAAGVAQGIAELVEQATEAYLKDVIARLCAHSKSNVEGGIITAKHRRQLKKEEQDVERGVLQRNAAGLLPAEVELSLRHEPLDASDLRLALQLGNRHLKSEPFLAESMIASYYPSPPDSTDGASPLSRPLTNGITKSNSTAMDIDSDDTSWQGSGKADLDGLMSELDDCLAVG